jgi:hypothetical protein
MPTYRPADAGPGARGPGLTFGFFELKRTRDRKPSFE